MKAIEDLTPCPTAGYSTTYLGQTLVVSAEDAEKARSAARNSLVEVVARSRRRYETAVGRYQGQKEVDDEFWLSGVAHAAAWIGTGGEHSDPGSILSTQKQVLRSAEMSVQRLVAEGRLVAAAEEATKSEVASGHSAALVRAYIDETLEGAGDVVSDLEFTQDAAFVTLGVLAVVVTAGAAAGLAPAVVGTGVAGMSVGTTATVISVGAPLVASVGVRPSPSSPRATLSTGPTSPPMWPSRWCWRGSAASSVKKVFGKLAGNPATRTAVRRVLASVGSGVVTHEASQVFTVSVDADVRGPSRRRGVLGRVRRRARRAHD